MNVSIPLLSFSSLIIFFAFFIRSLIGFGGALISIPLLALLFDLKFAVPMEALLELVFSILIIRHVYKKINKPMLTPLVIGALVGAAIGSYILKSFANVLLKKALGVVIILFAVDMVRRKNKDTRLLPSGLGFIAGLIGGILGGIFGTSGPPFVIYLTHQLKRKDVFRASLIGLFTITVSWRLTTYVLNGLLTLEILKMAVLLTPALTIGTFLGSKTHANISEDVFRKVVAAILIISGLMLLK